MPTTTFCLTALVTILRGRQPTTDTFSRQTPKTKCAPRRVSCTRLLPLPSEQELRSPQLILKMGAVDDQLAQLAIVAHQNILIQHKAVPRCRHTPHKVSNPLHPRVDALRDTRVPEEPMRVANGFPKQRIGDVFGVTQGVTLVMHVRSEVRTINHHPRDVPMSGCIMIVYVLSSNTPQIIEHELWLMWSRKHPVQNRVHAILTIGDEEGLLCYHDTTRPGGQQVSKRHAATERRFQSLHVIRLLKTGKRVRGHREGGRPSTGGTACPPHPTYHRLFFVLLLIPPTPYLIRITIDDYR